ncbi:MAG TPA: hypothetical protein VFM69_12675, partial [Pricia sp.]|nr:hypothetical protein [Pricia sp.]
TNAVTNVKMADNSVGTAEIINSGVTTTKIASGGNDRVLTTNATGIVTWADKSTLNTNLATDNLTQDAESRTYNMNGQNLGFTNGFFGIGSATPDAQLDVEGGSVRFTDYASATTPYENSSANYMLATDAEGDVVQVNTVKASRVFYPPSIAIDASTNGTFTIDLYAQYIAQFGSPVVSSGGTIPTYNANELDYHVTYADPTVFNTGTMSISPAGVLTYSVTDQPADYNSLINVVFVVK